MKTTTCCWCSEVFDVTDTSTDTLDLSEHAEYTPDVEVVFCHSCGVELTPHEYDVVVCTLWLSSQG